MVGFIFGAGLTEFRLLDQEPPEEPFPTRPPKLLLLLLELLLVLVMGGRVNGREGLAALVLGLEPILGSLNWCLENEDGAAAPPPPALGLNSSWLRIFP